MDDKPETSKSCLWTVTQDRIPSWMCDIRSQHLACRLVVTLSRFCWAGVIDRRTVGYQAPAPLRDWLALLFLLYCWRTFCDFRSWYNGTKNFGDQRLTWKWLQILIFDCWCTNWALSFPLVANIKFGQLIFDVWNNESFLQQLVEKELE